MTSPVKVLMITEGSGGHLIPALEVAGQLSRQGARVKVWYASRPQTAPLVPSLVQKSAGSTVEVEPMPSSNVKGSLGRVVQCARLWSGARRCFQTFRPDVIVGFGGWVSVPVMLAARLGRRPTMLHEQNVVMGRANRLLSRVVDQVAVSFQPTSGNLPTLRTVITGMPVRPEIGRSVRATMAQRFGLDACRPTVLVLGGSQGSRAINRLLGEAAGLLSSRERRSWQWLHVSGSSGATRAAEAYAAHGVRAAVVPFIPDMETAYALADLVIGRAGASTVAELARCGKPAVLIPYPHAGGHQRANARMVEQMGGGVVLEESSASAARLLREIRRLLADDGARATMGERMRLLCTPDAATRLARAILDLPHAISARLSEAVLAQSQPRSERSL